MFLNKFQSLKVLTKIVFFVLLCETAHLYEVAPYIGIDAQINRIRFKEGYGNNLFPKHYPQINLYAGLKTKDNNALELGYISEAVKSKYSTLHTNDCCLGMHVHPLVSPAVFKSYIKIRGHHLSLVHFYSNPVLSNFRLGFGAGAAFLKAQAERDCVSMGTPPIKGNRRTFQKHKAVFRFMIAPEYKFYENLGVRASFCFLNTSKMKIKAEPIPGRFTPVIRPKNSFVYSLGMFLEF